MVVVVVEMITVHTDAAVPGVYVTGTWAWGRLPAAHAL